MLATSGTLYDGCPRPRFQVPIKVAEMTKCEACDAARGPHRSPGLFAAVHPAKNRLENGPKPDGGEGGLDRVGRSQMYPMLRGVVVERQQHIDVLGDLRDCLSPDFSCGLAVSGGGGAGRLVGLLVAGGYGKSPGVAPVGGLS